MQDCTKIDFDLRLRLYQTQNTRLKLYQGSAPI